MNGLVFFGGGSHADDLLQKAMGTATGLQCREVDLSTETADYSCPACDFSTVPRVNRTAEMFQCGTCDTVVTEQGGSA